MLRIIYSGNFRAISYPVDPNATFEPGMVAQFKVIGNDVVLGVSDGTAPFGIIDDIKTTAFSAPAKDEIIIIPGVPVFDGYKYVNAMDTTKELANANIVASSFTVDYPGLQLNPINGILRAPAGIELNYAVNSAFNNVIRARANYSYYVPNISGEDTTIGSGRVSVWMTRGIFQTDQYEMTAYSVNATLFVGPGGKLTSEQTLNNQPGVAMCITPPTAHNPFLEFQWF